MYPGLQPFAIPIMKSNSPVRWGVLIEGSQMTFAHTELTESQLDLIREALCSCGGEITLQGLLARKSLSALSQNKLIAGLQAIVGASEASMRVLEGRRLLFKWLAPGFTRRATPGELGLDPSDHLDMVEEKQDRGPRVPPSPYDPPNPGTARFRMLEMIWANPGLTTAEIAEELRIPLASASTGISALHKGTFVEKLTEEQPVTWGAGSCSRATRPVDLVRAECSKPKTIPIVAGRLGAA